MKRKMRSGMWCDREQPHPKSGAGWGHRWDSLLLNQGLLLSQGSSGTVMSALGHREGRRQTKGRNRQEGGGVGEGNHRGIDTEDLQR